MSDELVRTDDLGQTGEQMKADELMRTDELGLMFDPAAFTYTSPVRRPLQTRKLYERHEVRFLDEVAYRPVSWFWTGRIPENKLTVIEGPPQSGKSLLAIDLAARASRGGPLPGESAIGADESTVQLVGGYDDVHDTVLPRIRRAGGILSNFGQLSRVARSRGDVCSFGSSLGANEWNTRCLSANSV